MAFELPLADLLLDPLDVLVVEQGHVAAVHLRERRAARVALETRRRRAVEGRLGGGTQESAHVFTRTSGEGGSERDGLPDADPLSERVCPLRGSCSW